MNSKQTPTFLNRFAKKVSTKKMSFDLPQSVHDLIEEYCRYASSHDVEIDRNELATESFKTFFSRDSGFQEYRRSKSGG